MRKRFEVQYELGTTPIEKIVIPKSRDELPPVIKALQYIYITPEINEQVFNLLESKIEIKKTGRTGTTLWEILVLGVVRLTLDANYDRLEDMANHHKLIRDLLGVNTFAGTGKHYPLQTIKDNISLLDEQVIEQISEIVVKTGHNLLKKKDEELEIKVDSYVLESNVHFPTDINLLWDSVRKSLDMTEHITREKAVCGWRKLDYWRRSIKNLYNRVNRIAFGGGKNKSERLLNITIDYIRKAIEISKKIKASKPELKIVSSGSLLGMLSYNSLEYYEEMLDKHIDLVYRRIIQGEQIPHSEKIFSIFETYTEWINKGKAGNKIELGLKVSICTDQYGFIVHHRIMENEQDVEAAVPLAEALFSKWSVLSISFDKGYWNKDNYTIISSKVKNVTMPKKGKLNKEEYAREHDKEFIKKRRKHSAIESDINGLEHHGLDRCPDKGKINFRRYAALGVLSLNLHRLGNALIAEEKKSKGFNKAA